MFGKMKSFLSNNASKVALVMLGVFSSINTFAITDDPTAKLTLPPNHIFYRLYTTLLGEDLFKGIFYIYIAIAGIALLMTILKQAENPSVVTIIFTVVSFVIGGVIAWKSNSIAYYIGTEIQVQDIPMLLSNGIFI